MKRLFLSLMLLLFAIGCEELPTPPSEQPEEPNSELDIEGYWYMVEENRLYTLDIREGKAILVEHYYEDGEWQSVEMALVYTISDSEIVVPIIGQEVWRAKVAVTADVMSISNDEVAYLFQRYDGLVSSLEEVMREIEENTLDETPNDNITTDDYFNSESNIEMALVATYRSMIDAAVAQLNLENIRVAGTDLYGVPKIITPNTEEVLSAWEKLYGVANNAKIIVDNLDRDAYPRYYDEALAIKAFIYYNLAMLYGNVVEYESMTDCIVYNASETLDMVEDMLESVGELDNEQYRLSTDDILALRAEIALYRGAGDYAASLLTEGADFELSVDAAQYPQYYEMFGEAITIYSTAKIQLFEKEISGADTTADWLALDEERYGYWAMLKRVEVACEVTGCEEYELLMPIPQFEIMRNPQLVQNEGY